MDKETAKKEIQLLVEKYDQVVQSGRLKSYNEEMTKKDFILPLFRALGWKVEDGEEVTAEEKISRKRVDYGFRIDGIPKFFLEAKSLKEDLENIKFVEQAINYSWHKGCTWAILSDFEGIKVFNAEWKSANPLQNMFFGINCQQFLDRFDQLWLLSKESFASNEIDKEAEKWGKKAKKVPVDKQLLTDMTVFREILSKNILKDNASKNLSVDELDESVQRILDRLIFIRTLEDKELEAPMLQSLIREDTHKRVYKKLNNLFRQIDNIYNSKLFVQHLCEDLEIDDNILEKVIRGLFKTSDNTVHYDFGVIDADVLGNIYEQYLGHILKTTPKRAKLSNGKAHRKEQGIYYTPTYVVDYIVKNTVGELAKDRKFDLKNIKILDPACGSGSFLMKAFDYLVTLDKKKNGEIDQTKLDLTGESATYGRKVEILKDNIFGVDLDAKAVEIAQLNLLLKAAEKKHRLPTLQENIKVGNSLIDDIRFVKFKPLKWQEEFREIMDKGGFDVVIGNPPYINAIQLTKTYGKEVKDFWKNKYSSSRGTYDIYILFFEQALNLCKYGGYVAFITPNKFLSSPYGVAFRQFINQNYKLVKIFDLSQVNVFEDPSVYPVVTIFQKIKQEKRYDIQIERFEIDENSKIISDKISSKNLEMLPENIWGLLLTKGAKIIERIYNNSTPLEECAEVQATSTAAESDEFSKHIKEGIDGLSILNSGTIDRFATSYGYVRFLNKGKQLFFPKLDISKIKDTRKELYQNQKIVFAKLALRLEGFVDLKGDYASINTNCVHSPKDGYDLLFLAGLLNSKLMSYIYGELFSGLRMSGGYYQYQAPQLRVLPIIKSKPSQQNKIKDLVGNIIQKNEALTKLHNKKTDEKVRLEKEIKKLDDEIDQEVYKLYGLNKKEIEIVETILDKI